MVRLSPQTRNRTARRPRAFGSLLALILLGIGSNDLVADNGKELFRRDVLPILTNHCFACHGPDQAARAGKLRLDRVNRLIEKSATQETIINPGRPLSSALFLRITSSDPDQRMPPADHGPPLTTAERNKIRDWILKGAPVSGHWAFQRPVRPALPRVNNVSWPASPIDFFILHKLEMAGLSPSPRADRYTLLRRISLDLTGLPPTMTEIDAFQKADAPRAWPGVVERLLGSPRFGEQMAQSWLDAARYADTTGHAADKPRTMWLYRDWVIRAFNQNMPFDQFTIEQLAGDMLPSASESQIIATGFHRNSMQALGNNPRKEEFRVKGIVDRLDTTGRVWMGLTLGCAECHNHKYDPISQKEYYQLFAVFNNVPHYGQKFDVHGPRLKVLPEHIQRRIATLERKIRDLPSGARKAAQGPSIQSWAQEPASVVKRQHPAFHLTFGKRVVASSFGSAEPSLRDSAHWDSVLRAPGPLPRTPALTLKGRRSLTFGSGVPQLNGNFSIGMWIRTGQKVADLASRYDWKADRRSYVFGIGGQSEPESRAGKLYAWLSDKPAPFRGPIIYGSVSVNDNKWHHVAVRYVAGKSIQLYVDGRLDKDASVKGPYPLKIGNAQRPLSIGGGFDKSETANAFFFRGQIADVRIFARPLTGQQLGGMSHLERRQLAEFAKTPESEPTPSLRQLFARIQASFTDVDPRVLRWRRQIKELQSQQVTAQVMAELPQPRATFVHRRGNFEDKGERVRPALPRLFSESRPSDGALNRLSLARSLVGGRNPLTARVAVNRIWQHYFGRGLVRTVDDFGLRGEYPSHPQLLDWLAVEFIESGWNIKRLHRLIVSSAVYQQSSAASRVLRKRDPENRWLSRGPRRRLSAEQIRDLAVFASGNLVSQSGGPSVYPRQDPKIGAFRDKTAGKWVNSDGAGQFRRSLYTFWQRMSPYPSMILFDAPSREQCVVKRAVTNTPLQALTTLNDPHLVTMARCFGQQIEASASTIEGRIRFAFLTSLSRPPAADELAAFQRFLGSRPDSAKWFRLAQVLLNLDEAITKE